MKSKVTFSSRRSYTQHFCAITAGPSLEGAKGALAFLEYAVSKFFLKMIKKTVPRIFKPNDGSELGSLSFKRAFTAMTSK